MRLARNVNADVVYRSFGPVEEEISPPSEPVRDTNPPLCGPPPKGVIRYGLQVNIRSCFDRGLILGSRVADYTGKPLEEGSDVKDVDIHRHREGYRSRDTRVHCGHIYADLENRSGPLPDLPNARALLQKAERVWFSDLGWGCEMAILPSPLARDKELGDFVFFHDRVVICQADSFGGARYVLALDFGLAVGEKPRVLLKDLKKLLQANEPVPEWILTNPADIRFGSIITLNDPIGLCWADRGGALTVDTHVGAALRYADPAEHQLTSECWILDLVAAQPKTAQWEHHTLCDATVPTPLESMDPSLFSSTIGFTPEAMALITTDEGAVDLSVQEILLVMDCIHCLFGVAGEFITLKTDFPPVVAHIKEETWQRPEVSRLLQESLSVSRSLRQPAECPRFTHEYRTFVQVEGESAQWEAPTRMVDDNARDVTPQFESVAKLDESIRRMTDKIMELVHQVSLIRHVAEHHLLAPSTRTGEALGSAMKYILKELESRAADLEAWSSSGILSLQKLWSSLHEAKPALGLLNQMARMTYNVEGLSLMDILRSVRLEYGSNAALKSIASFIIFAAAQPLEQMLNEWVYEGILDDPRGEFFIVADPRLTRPETPIKRCLFWEGAFTLVESRVPSVLQAVAEKISMCGRVWHTLKNWLPAEDYALYREDFQFEHIQFESPAATAQIDRIAAFSESILYRVLVDKCDVFGRIKSAHMFYFMTQSDLVGDFVELAESDLASNDPNMEALTAKFRKAIATSTVASDPYVHSVSISNSQISMLTMARWCDPAWKPRSMESKLSQRLSEQAPVKCDPRAFAAPESRIESNRRECEFFPTIIGFVKESGIETDTADSALVKYLSELRLMQSPRTAFWNNVPTVWGLHSMMSDPPPTGTVAAHHLTYLIDAPWPLQIVFDMKTIIALQNIFRLLFSVTVTQKYLAVLWRDLSLIYRFDRTRPVEEQSSILKGLMAFRQDVAPLINNLMTYMTEEVLGPALEDFKTATLKVNSLEGLLDLHHKTLYSIMYQFFLTDSQSLSLMMRMMNDCTLLVKAFDFLGSLGRPRAVGVKPRQNKKALQFAYEEALRTLNQEGYTRYLIVLRELFNKHLAEFMDHMVELSRTAYGSHSLKMLSRLDFTGQFYGVRREEVECEEQEPPQCSRLLRRPSLVTQGQI